MRLVAAIVSFVIAFGLIALGIAQRTVFAEPDNVTASVALTGRATVTFLDNKTLRSLDGRQTVDISGADKVFAGYGRTEDVLAWIGKASYNDIRFVKGDNTLASKLVKGDETRVPDPRGSDLWLGEYSRAKSLDFTVNVPSDISMIIVSDGTKPAPDHLSIRWPLDNRTPWAGPLVVAGGILLLIGLGLYFWALAHLRRSRGPRRKTPKMPKVPRQRSYRPHKQKVTVSGRRSSRRRMIAVVPVVLIGTLGISGCSADLWPQFGSDGAASAVPKASATVPVTAGQSPPAVTLPQLKRIVARISEVATKADADKNADLAKTRFVDAALDLRTATYAIRTADSSYAPASTLAAAPAIPSGDIVLTLPQQTKTWPRTVFTVVQKPGDKTVPPVALMLVQDAPRDNFKVAYATALEASAKLPDVAPASVGASRLLPDVKLFQLAPSKVAMAYGDILANGTASPYFKEFDTTKDTLITRIGQDARKKQQADLPTASMTFANSDGPADSIALGSSDSGAIVTVYLNETVTVKPNEAGASVNPEGAVKSLSGISGSTKGTEAVYGDQLLFYLPPVSSTNKIVLLGFATGLVSAKELP
ncbi:MAG TPA: hypothetical protein VGC18_00345 [Lacisediminihabitans sp.]|uniref:hypothetical protein n=1 Tax=Lacisediminihabitans sp. TaxID=2787631 RepID=UPI002ED9067F